MYTERTPKRVASLLPSATEIVCALGATDELAGVSHVRDGLRVAAFVHARIRAVRRVGPHAGAEALRAFVAAASRD